MKQKIINNLFELWKQVGTNAQFLHSTAHYTYLSPDNYSWPSKVFELKSAHVNFKELHTKIENGNLPNSISILEDTSLENQILVQGFTLKSTVKGMYLDLQENGKPENNFTTIEKVDDHLKASEFAKIATLSFGYEVLSSTITSLINSPKLKLFIGKYQNHYASCGLILLDENGISGLHMIGTVSEYRGLGLGKIMTNQLLLEAYENKSKQVVLVASESGERIYSKLGFISQGSLKSYSINKLS